MKKKLGSLQVDFKSIDTELEKDSSKFHSTHGKHKKHELRKKIDSLATKKVDKTSEIDSMKESISEAEEQLKIANSAAKKQ